VRPALVDAQEVAEPLLPLSHERIGGQNREALQLSREEARDLCGCRRWVARVPQPK
jgi:hypothetical protein